MTRPHKRRRFGFRWSMAAPLRYGSLRISTCCGTLPARWTREVRAFAATLEQRAGIPVALLDERMTSVRAEKAVRELGLKKKQREQKERIDSAAALLLLQMHLDQRKRT